ncbi:MAG: hypothetical protein QHJ73_04190, partial [Armatimonadota bacterium]|nr:hypothetical protein [Armatimonadota bacterium]
MVKAQPSAPAARSPAIRRGMEITAAGREVVVAAGECQVAGRVVKVAGPVALPVRPAPVVEVRDEPLHLSPERPAGWAKGTRLKGCNARDVNAFGAFA